jgi:hypothetical protein
MPTGPKSISLGLACHGRDARNRSRAHRFRGQAAILVLENSRVPPDCPSRSRAKGWLARDGGADLARSTRTNAVSFCIARFAPSPPNWCEEPISPIR